MFQEGTVYDHDFYELLSNNVVQKMRTWVSHKGKGKERVCVFVDNSKGVFYIYFFLRFFCFCYLTKMIMA